MEMNPNELYEVTFNREVRQCIQLQYDNFDMKKLWETDMGNLKMESYNLKK